MVMAKTLIMFGVRSQQCASACHGSVGSDEEVEAPRHTSTHNTSSGWLRLYGLGVNRERTKPHVSSRLRKNFFLVLTSNHLSETFTKKNNNKKQKTKQKNTMTMLRSLKLLM